jgi:transposase
MARKNYSEEFRRQAVDLYESTPGATVRGIAEDLGIVRGTLRHWLEVYGTGKKTAADGTLTSNPLQSKKSPASSSAPAGETPETEPRGVVGFEVILGAYASLPSIAATVSVLLVS